MQKNNTDIISLFLLTWALFVIAKKYLFFHISVLSSLQELSDRTNEAKESIPDKLNFYFFYRKNNFEKENGNIVVFLIFFLEIFF